MQELERKKSLILLSGGLDSVTLFYLLWKEEIPFECLIIDYGQPGQKELEYAKELCQVNNIKYDCYYLDRKLFFKNKNPKTMKNLGVLPNRNGIFLSIATTYAIQHNLNNIYYGALGDVSQSYMDCKPVFVERFNHLLEVSDLSDVKIIAPFIDKTKEDIVELALDLGVDIHRCWSCDINLDRPCGKCDSCSSRKQSENKVRQKYLKKLKILNNNNYGKSSH